MYSAAKWLHQRELRRLSASLEPAMPDSGKIDSDQSRKFKSERLEDDEATEVLELILELRRAVEQDHKPALHRAFDAVDCCNTLIRGIMEWVAKDLRLLRSRAEYHLLSIEEKRRLVAVNVGLGLPVFQDEARTGLADSLLALNGGQDNSFVRKTKARRRRAAPWEAAVAELDLLKWIRWQHGLGRKVADAETDVSQAVGCTREAIQKWRVKLPEVLDEKWVRDELLVAELVGKYEARAEGQIDYRPRDSDFGHILWSRSQSLDRVLPEIAERRRAAVAKRRVANPEDR